MPINMQLHVMTCTTRWPGSPIVVIVIPAITSSLCIPGTILGPVFLPSLISFPAPCVASSPVGLIIPVLIPPSWSITIPTPVWHIIPTLVPPVWTITTVTSTPPRTITVTSPSHPPVVFRWCLPVWICPLRVVASVLLARSIMVIGVIGIGPMCGITIMMVSSSLMTPCLWSSMVLSVLIEAWVLCSCWSVIVIRFENVSNAFLQIINVFWYHFLELQDTHTHKINELIAIYLSLIGQNYFDFF